MAEGFAAIPPPPGAVPSEQCPWRDTSGLEVKEAFEQFLIDDSKEQFPKLVRPIYCVKVNYGNAPCLGGHPRAFLIPVHVPCPCLCWQLQNLCALLSGAGSWQQEVPLAGRCHGCVKLCASCPRSPAGWAASSSYAQRWEGTVGASSKPPGRVWDLPFAAVGEMPCSGGQLRFLQAESVPLSLAPLA